MMMSSFLVTTTDYEVKPFISNILCPRVANKLAITLLSNILILGLRAVIVHAIVRVQNDFGVV